MSGTTTMQLAPFFDPRSISGCSLWFDAADESTLTGRANVTQWRDKASSLILSGTGASFTRANGIPLVTFNANQYVTTTNLPYASLCTSDANFTCFLVQATATNSGVNGLPFSIFLPGNERRFAVFANGSSGGGSIFVDAASQANPRLSFSQSQTLGSPQLLTITRTNITRVTNRYNGLQSATQVFINPVNFLNRTTYLVYISEGSGPWRGNMYEILHFNRDLLDSEILKVEGYLAWKWGLQGSLPSNHPFKLNPFSPLVPVAIPKPIGSSRIGLDPRSISGCQLWLDAADSTVFSLTGSSVTQWRDKSGNGRNLGVGSGTISYANNAITLASSYMFVTSAVDLTNFAFFIIAKTNGSVNNQTVFGARPNTASVFNSVDGFGFYMDFQTAIRFYGNPFGNSAFSAFSATISTPNIFSFASGPTVINSWFNGNSVSGAASQPNRTNTAQGFAIGAEWSGSSYVNLFVTASIYEIIVYNTSSFSTNQRQQVEGYLAWKWGLVANLPSSHPFKNSPLGAQSPQLTLPIALRSVPNFSPRFTSTFTYTGSNQTFVVPSGVTSLGVYLWGAGGGGNGGTGGAAAMVQGILTVSPGQSLTIIVGQGGVIGLGNSFGGGGAGQQSGNGTSGRGGGRSAIQFGGSDRVTAGGGGGCGYNTGNGGSATFSGTANDGLNGKVAGVGIGGKGGTQGAGGQAGINAAGGITPLAGSLFQGGNSGGQGASGGGGGGGGYYGGGGGGGGGFGGGSADGGSGGGGGSSFTTQLQRLAFNIPFGFNSSNGVAAPNSSSPFWASGIGAGGSAGNGTGGNGRVVIQY
jgi:hypothetical protein